MLTSMRAVMLQPPPGFLEERRRLGHDLRDEVWDGELHMVPPPALLHQKLSTKLVVFLAPIVAARGFELIHEAGLYESERNYRVPDVTVYDAKHESPRGIDGHAILAIEILSPSDESREKLPFFAKLGVTEVWLVEPDTRTVEVYVLRGDRYFAVAPDPNGATRAPALGIALETLDGPKLQLTAGDVSTAI